mgnify:CR=1 FL=1
MPLPYRCPDIAFLKESTLHVDKIQVRLPSVGNVALMGFPKGPLAKTIRARSVGAYGQNGAYGRVHGYSSQETIGNFMVRAYWPRLLLLAIQLR